MEDLAVWLSRPFLYFAFHAGRVFCWVPLLAWWLRRSPRRALLAIAAYALVHRTAWWQRAFHKIVGAGASRRPKIVSPYAHLIDPSARYLWTSHPHGMLQDVWHSIIARNLDAFTGHIPGIGRKWFLCFAPIISSVPFHQEMYRDRCGPADAKTIARVWRTPDMDPFIVPGGFSEAVFSSSYDEKEEYSYLKGRKGFLKVAIENGKDIVPMYCFGQTKMYRNPRILRGARARFSQKVFLGVAWPFGKWGTPMPLTNEQTIVVFPPFPATRFSLQELDAALDAYMAHLKLFFDKHKAEYGMANRELTFVGKDFRDEDAIARGLRFFSKL